MEISQPDIDYPQWVPEPVARSPSPSMLDPPTPEPELAEKDSALLVVASVENVTISTVFAMFTNGFRIPVKNINSGLYPPKRLPFYTSGADPPRNGEVRIRSPAA